MPYIEDRLVHDADAHIMETPSWLRAHADPAIRERIAFKSMDWQRAVGDRGFRRHFDLGGESLKRPPRGFSKDHKLIEDIKRKSFIAIKNMDVGDCLHPQFQRRVETAFKAATPYMKFLCKAVGGRV